MHIEATPKIIQRIHSLLFGPHFDNGADAIELNVHLTQDNELIVHHDYYFGNPDNGEGVMFQKDSNYAKNLQITPNEHIPKLEEVFEQIGNRLQYEIELKGFTEKFIQRIIGLVKKYKLARYIEFTSPHSYILTRLKKLEPTFKTGIFIAPLPEWMDVSLGQTLAINNALLGNGTVLHCPLTMIDKDFIKAVHAHGLLMHAADCNKEEDIRKAFDLKVDQFSTNNLELALEIRRETN